MFSKPRILAHIGFLLVTAGLVISMLIPPAYPVSLGLWLIAVVAGVFALIKNGRLFPNIALTRTGEDPDKLDILHFVEVYLSLIPGIFIVAYLIYFKIFN
ncbi:MAG TPA: hypothetical protein ENN75_00695 [candidate division Zixibacteria bacterium]|nr:hypothetical protein [candidate division Zixibacteria bacterium]